MTKFRLGIPVLALLVSVGCVGQNQHDKMQTLYRQSEEQVVELKAQLEEARARIAALQNSTPSTVTTSYVDPSLLNQLEQLKAERSQMANRIQGLEATIRQLAQTEPQLPAELDSALTDLARQHSDIMTYDPSLGMVKLASDLTFGLGSTDVSANASNSLQQLATILSGGAASGFEARIVGHTDNVPIRKAATKRDHPTNWHLSVHRAIAVKDVLQKSGVPAVRLGVAGYGEFRPIAPNDRKGNETNRRVEIYIVPTTETGVAITPSPLETSSAPAAITVSEPAPSEPATEAPAPVEDYFK